MRMLLVAVLVLIVASFAALQLMTPKSSATFQPAVATPQPVAQSAPKLTMDRYLALQDGMSFAEVALTLGTSLDYKEVSTAGEIVTYECRDGDRFVIVTLDGGRLVSKVQSGL